MLLLAAYSALVTFWAVHESRYTNDLETTDKDAVAAISESAAADAVNISALLYNQQHPGSLLAADTIRSLLAPLYRDHLIQARAVLCILRNQEDFYLVRGENRLQLRRFPTAFDMLVRKGASSPGPDDSQAEALLASNP